MRRVVALATGLAACDGTTGTYALELTTAPGATLLDQISRARLTLSSPPRTALATRDPADGRFHLSLEVPADGPSGFVTFEGFDPAGGLVGWGRSGALPMAALDAAIVIYVGAPESLAAAPVALDPPRAELGVAGFAFGALLVGGSLATGAASAAVSAYDVYSHRLLAGADLPAPRAAAAVASSPSGSAYTFGGRAADGLPTGTLWRFDTTVEPRGEWRLLDDDPDLARTAGAAVRVGPERFVATGDPPALIDGRSFTVSELTGVPALAGTASSVVIDDQYYAVFVGAGSGSTGLVRLGPSGLAEVPSLPTARRTNHGAAVTSDGKVVVLGGAVDLVPTRTGIIADPVADTYREVADVLATARVGAAVARAGRVIIVAGGRDAASGALVPTAEVVDAATLAPIAIVPMVTPRAGASAIAIGNGQVLIAGGIGADDRPVATLELYTAAAP